MPAEEEIQGDMIVRRAMSLSLMEREEGELARQELVGRAAPGAAGFPAIRFEGLGAHFKESATFWNAGSKDHRGGQ